MNEPRPCNIGLVINNNKEDVWKRNLVLLWDALDKLDKVQIDGNNVDAEDEFWDALKTLHKGVEGAGVVTAMLVLSTFSPDKLAFCDEPQWRGLERVIHDEGLEDWLNDTKFDFKPKTCKLFHDSVVTLRDERKPVSSENESLDLLQISDALWHRGKGKEEEETTEEGKTKKSKPSTEYHKNSNIQ